MGALPHDLEGIEPLTFMRPFLSPVLMGLLLVWQGWQSDRLLAQQNSLYDPEQLVEIRIEFATPDWDRLLDSLKRAGQKERIPATVTINGERFEQVGVRYKGNSSYFNVRKHGHRKLPFNLKADAYREGQRFPGGFETIKLSNGFRDPSFIREVLSYEIARQYMPASRANMAKLYVNGEYLGLYTNTESVNEDFLERYFKDHNNTFFKCDPEWHAEQHEGCSPSDKASLQYLGDEPVCYRAYYERKSHRKKDWEKLIELCYLLNKEPQRIEEVLDVDMALWMLAFNNLLVNLDSYTGRLCHNYYLYRLPDGRFTPIVWDMNLSFGGFRYAGLGKSLSNEQMQQLSPFLHYKQQNEKRPLITKLLRNNLYRKIYLAHLKTMLEEQILSGVLERQARAWYERIDREVQNDPNKLYSYEAFKSSYDQLTLAGKSKIIGIGQLMEARQQYLSKHPVFQGEMPEIEKVEALRFDDELVFQAKVSEADRVWLAYRTKGPGHTFKRVEMYDDSGHSDEMTDDGIWGIEMPYQAGIEYYIIAEGKKIACLFPKRASFEYLRIE